MTAMACWAQRQAAWSPQCGRDCGCVSRAERVAAAAAAASAPPLLLVGQRRACCPLPLCQQRVERRGHGGCLTQSGSARACSQRRRCSLAPWAQGLWPLPRPPAPSPGHCRAPPHAHVPSEAAVQAPEPAWPRSPLLDRQGAASTARAALTCTPDPRAWPGGQVRCESESLDSKQFGLLGLQPEHHPTPHQASTSGPLPASAPSCPRHPPAAAPASRLRQIRA